MSFYYCCGVLLGHFAPPQLVHSPGSDRLTTALVTVNCSFTPCDIERNTGLLFLLLLFLLLLLLFLILLLFLLLLLFIILLLLLLLFLVLLCCSSSSSSSSCYCSSSSYYFCSSTCSSSCCCSSYSERQPSDVTSKVKNHVMAESLPAVLVGVLYKAWQVQ